MHEQDDDGLGLGKPALMVAGRLSWLGERLGVGWLTYNPVQMVIYHRYAVREAPGVIRSFEEIFPAAKAYVDIGCGSGAYAAEAVRRGHLTIGLERSRVGRLIARRQGVDCRPFDLRKDLPAPAGTRFDLAYCLEVAEHLPPGLGEALVDVTCSLAPNVVFSAAPPGQGGVGHINEQPPQHWRERFAVRGFRHDSSATLALRESFDRNGIWAPWLKGNASVYIGSG